MGAQSFRMPATIALTEMLEQEDVHLGFQTSSVVEAVPRLLRSPLAKRGLSPAAVQEIIDAVIRRERETLTLCGSLALPHTRSADVDEFVFSVGTNAAGLIAGQADPRLIFVFVSPENKREQHLQLLASLARLSQNPEVVDQIARASNARQVIDALRIAGV
jgi:mannitol/fructose-specific phosphotransferase system IIA component (Ntr-type)